MSRYSKGLAGSTWSRLKTPLQDPLDSVGLPSKGDARYVLPIPLLPISQQTSYFMNSRKKLLSLVDLRAQEKYYTVIVERYIKFCSTAGQRDELIQKFSSLDIGHDSSDTTVTEYPNISPASDAEILQKPSNARTLSTLVSALRKLREGIVASKRADVFAIQAYLFCIRLSVLIKQPDSYHPAILHLLREIHSRQPLTVVDLNEIVSYLILDTACRRRAISEAFAIRQFYNLQEPKLDAILSSLVHDNYIMFHRLRRSVDGYRARLMEWAEQDLRLHTLKCFGKSYLNVDLAYLEASTNSEWKSLVSGDGVGWELNDEKVMIRKVNPKR